RWRSPRRRARGKPRLKAEAAFFTSHKGKSMRNLSAIVLIAAALGAGLYDADAQVQTPMPMARTVKAVQPGLLDVTGPRVSEALAAGLTKITAAPGKGGKSI